MTLYKNKYRIETVRLKTWDYASAGYYFVTICTKDRLCVLGEIREGVMMLTPQGLIVREEWLRTEGLRSNIVLDEWVIMPNHLHGIIVIKERDNHNAVETPRRGVSTNNGLVSGSLGAVIGQFKSVCTKRIRSAGHDFGWQARYYEHVIRDERSLREIREYIGNNPMKWDLDKNNPVNIRG